MSAQTRKKDVRRQLTALADPIRFNLVEKLTKGECCVCDLLNVVDGRQPLLSFHLKVLRLAGIVTARKEGRWMYYRINADALSLLSKSIAKTADRARKSDAQSNCC